jgi:RHS repeat-associated protein
LLFVGGQAFAQARYYNTKHGRFTSVDPLTASANVKDPQTFNRYSYVLNSPYKFSDPLGLLPESAGCGFRCRVENAIAGNSKLSGDDLALAQFHVANGTALGYFFQNTAQAEIGRQSQQDTNLLTRLREIRDCSKFCVKVKNISSQI